MLNNLTTHARLTKLFLAALLSGLSTMVFADPVDSGFLNNYSNLKPDPDIKDAWAYEEPGLNPSKYKYIVVPEVEIAISPDSPYKSFGPTQVSAVSHEMHQEIVRIAEQHRPVISKPRPGSIVIRSAITGVELKKKKRRLLSFTPIGFTVHALRGLAGQNVSIQSAQMEVMFVDGESGDVVASMVGLPDSKAAGKESTSWADIEGTIRHWARVLEQHINDFHSN